MIFLAFSFGAYIRLVIQKENHTLFFNECKKENIVLFNIIKTHDSYLADVKINDYKAVCDISDKLSCKIAVKGRFGFLMKLILSRGRKAFYLIIVFLALYYGIN